MSEKSTESVVVTAADHDEYPRPGELGQGTPDSENNLSGDPKFSVPPADTGKEAWLFLGASFIVNALTWGYAFSFGVFQDYYSQHAPFSTSGDVAMIGTSAVGVLYLFSPIVLGVCQRYPRHARFATPVGLFIASLALSLASLATSTNGLIALQGVLYAVGAAIGYCLTIPYIDEWFVTRKGLAYGIVWGGEGIASSVIPLLLERSLAKFGHQITLLGSGVLLFVICAPLSVFIKPRLPPSDNTPVPSWGFKFVFSSVFAPYQIGNLIQGTGLIIPEIYLPLYARTVFGASSFLSALTVLFINISSTVGCVIMGMLTDYLPAKTCILISSVGAIISVFFIWGFSSSLPVLYIFCILYGLFAGSYTSSWPGIMRALGRSNDAGDRRSNDAGDASNAIDPSMIYGWLCVGRGIGNLIAGPLIEAISKNMIWEGHAVAGYGSGFGGLILYTGITAVLGCVGILGKK